MNLKKKITITSLLLTLVPLLLATAITIYIANKQTVKALEDIALEELSILRNVKKSEVEQYFNRLSDVAVALAQLPYTADALIKLTKAAQQLPQEAQIKDKQQLVQQLTPFYQEFKSHYNEKNHGEMPISPNQLLNSLDTDALLLQTKFVANQHGNDRKQHSNSNSEYNHLHQQYHPYLKDYVRRIGFYELFLVDADSGRVVYTVNKEIDFGTSLKTGPFVDSGLGKAYREGMGLSKGDYSIIDFAPFLPSHGMSAGFIATPIMYDNSKKGILVLELSVTQLNKIMTYDSNWKEAGLGESAETYLVGQDRLIRSESRFFIEDKSAFLKALTDSNKFSDQVLNNINKQHRAVGNLAIGVDAAKTSLSGQTGANKVLDYRGVEVLSAYAPINVKGLNWTILAERDETEAIQYSDEVTKPLLRDSVLFMLLMAVLAALFAYKFADMITKPILQVSEFVKGVAKSFDLTARYKLKRDDEIGDMTDAFNGLLSTFQQSMNDVSDASNQIAAASEETSAITEQSSHVLQVQQSETEQVTTSMNEMTATMNDVAKNTTNTYSLADSATEQVDVGARAMNKTIEGIQGLAETLTKSSQTVSELEQSSNHISSVLDVINSIAEQTNLLALNAAIEAARAGEHGRGFAVVADEVRGLASRTQDSISEITKVITELQDGSKQAVASMNQSQDQVVDTVNQAEVTGEALKSISDVIQNINDMTRQIATAAEQQGAVVEEINRNVVRINDTGVETAQGATETSQASQELARLASDLNMLVAKFKV